MANYTVPAGDAGVHGKQLVAATVDAVTFTSLDAPEVEVTSDGTAEIYVSFGTTKPTVTGAMCYRVPAGCGVAVFEPRTRGDTVVKLVSSGTPVYSVSRT